MNNLFSFVIINRDESGQRGQSGQIDLKLAAFFAAANVFGKANIGNRK